MPVVLILPARLPWTDNRDGLLLRSPLIRDLGSSSLLFLRVLRVFNPAGPGNYTPRGPPICEVPSSETRMSGSDHAFWAHRDPRAAKDQQELQAFLRSPLIGVQVPQSPQGPPIETLEELGFSSAHLEATPS